MIAPPDRRINAGLQHLQVRAREEESVRGPQKQFRRRGLKRYKIIRVCPAPAAAGSYDSDLLSLDEAAASSPSSGPEAVSGPVSHRRRCPAIQEDDEGW